MYVPSPLPFYDNNNMLVIFLKFNLSVRYLNIIINNYKIFNFYKIFSTYFVFQKPKILFSFKFCYLSFSFSAKISYISLK